MRRSMWGVLGLLPGVLAVGVALAEEPIVAGRAIVSLIDEVEVPAQETGVISEIQIKEGTFVDQGDLLARIDDRQAQLALREAELEAEISISQAKDMSSLKFAEQSLEIARSALERVEETVRRTPNSISKTELEQYQLRVAEAEAALAQNKVEVRTRELTAKLAIAHADAAKEQLERRRVYAPLKGVVLDVKRQTGEWVAPGESLLRVVRLDRLRCEGFVKASEDPQRMQGARVELVVEMKQGVVETFPGVIEFVSPEVEPVSREVMVFAAIENRDLKLRPGMTGEMRIFPKK